jgi:hypothetical protein
MEAGVFLINGSPVQIVTQMPNVATGATPVTFGNWKVAYMMVTRKSVTMDRTPTVRGFACCSSSSAAWVVASFVRTVHASCASVEVSRRGGSPHVCRAARRLPSCLVNAGQPSILAAALAYDYPRWSNKGPPVH